MPIKVLFIDDDPGMTTLLELFLKDKKFEVQTANSGFEGVEIVRSWHPDIIVLDLMMPVMSGWEVCREVRMFSQTPILILSVVNEKEWLFQAINDGANGYMNKPITKSQLTTTILDLATHKISNLSSRTN